MARRKLKFVLLNCMLLAFVGSLAAIMGARWLIGRSTVDRVVDEAGKVPLNEVGLVLGTSKFVRGNVHNPHFDHRMAAAAALYRAGRVHQLLLSGDNGSRGYDEPADMKAALLTLGVPAEAMTLDDAGFRTLDSVVRAKEVFGQQKVTIITDRFHAYRAVFLAQHRGLDAVAFPSEEVELRYSARSKLREGLADVKACLDVWVLHTQPHFLGEPIAIHVASR